MTSVIDARPTTSTETKLAEVLAELVGVEQVSPDSHFFEDLGADSMVMAHFCARVRKLPDLPSVSMKEIYAHPTIRSLAGALAADSQSPEPTPVSEPAVMATPVGTPRYFLCGALQFLSMVVYFYLVALLAVRSYEWISSGSGFVDIYLRTVFVGGAGFLGLCTLPILVKWLLIGRWKPQRIRIWSLDYVRFWIVKTLIQLNPLVLFTGSPIYALYLRALGAKIGRDVVIFSSHVPVCTDLLTIGDGTVVRKDAFFSCYRARAGVIETGPVSIGKGAFVGEAAVLDIETSLGDEAQLGHSSSLHAGQSIPDGERRHGSPAQQRTEVDYRDVCPKRVGPLRKVAYVVVQLITALFVAVPLIVVVAFIPAALIPQLGALLGPGSQAFPSWIFVGEALAFSFALFFGLILMSLLVVMTVPRVLNLAIRPDTVYPLYGFAYWAHRAIVRLTNNTFFHHMLGDSSYIVPYFRCLGYDLPEVEQTGSNFGLRVKHDSPYLVTVGTGTMAADGLSIINADYSDTSFRMSRASIGARSFLGNYIAYPSQARAGENCLFATKVMVPVDGPLREGVGLLGSPDFEIPRTVERDRKFDHLAHGDEFRRRLAAKNRDNIAGIGLFLAGWIYLFELTIVAWVATVLYPSFGVSVYAVAALLALVLYVVHFVLVERLSTMFRPLQPQYCSIYDPYFWWHERHWRLAVQPAILNGTPFKGFVLRLLGVRIGRGVFDDGCIVMDKTLVSIGDDCALNAGSIIQPHSQEDRTFKAERIVIGAGCTLGTGALVHYGVTMGDGVELAPDSFLMKGEEVPPHTYWGGNPARELRGALAAAVNGGRSR